MHLKSIIKLVTFSLLLPSLPATALAENATKPTLVEDQNNLAYSIGQELRCPVCQGMPIAESPSPMAQAMMKKVREMVDEGKSRPEILGYFETRYGEWALLKPKAKGFNLLVWVLPPMGLIVGIFLVLRWMKRDQSKGQNPEAQARETDEDPYLRAVREEVEG